MAARQPATASPLVSATSTQRQILDRWRSAVVRSRGDVAADHQRNLEHHRQVIAILQALGLRRREVAALQVIDVGQFGHQVEVYVRNGKGGCERWVLALPGTEDAVRAVVADKEPEARASTTSPAPWTCTATDEATPWRSAAASPAGNRGLRRTGCQRAATSLQRWSWSAGTSDTGGSTWCCGTTYVESPVTTTALAVFRPTPA
ncbi:MAG TPA: hypothetical protein VIU62_09520 [Chloroflexota bacterium]